MACGWWADVGRGEMQADWGFMLVPSYPLPLSVSLTQWGESGCTVTHTCDEDPIPEWLGGSPALVP